MDAHEALSRIELEARLTIASVPPLDYAAKLSQIQGIAERALYDNVDPWKEGYEAGDSDATTRESVKYRALVAELRQLQALWGRRSDVLIYQKPNAYNRGATSLLVECLIDLDRIVLLPKKED